MADDSPYHEGEQAVQRRAGVRERAEQMGRMMIRAFMPDQHRELFAQLPFVLLGSLDGAGRPWASVLFGAPGFVQAPDAETLRIEARPLAGDPLAAALQPGQPLGLLGIQPETRRRNRVNGRLGELLPGGFTLHVDQSFGNCPKYIAARKPSAHAGGAATPPVPETAVLSARASALLRDSDTCFIASASSARPAAGDRRQGVDVSHRGGRPGFVHVGERAGATVLTMPDFAGNNAFNTLGNLVSYPRAGCLFLDFASGDVVQLTGQTEVVYEGPELTRFRGALRLLRLRVDEGLFFANALPFRWSQPESSPQSGKTGCWQEALDGREAP